MYIYSRDATIRYLHMDFPVFLRNPIFSYDFKEMFSLFSVFVLSGIEKILVLVQKQFFVSEDLSTLVDYSRVTMGANEGHMLPRGKGGYRNYKKGFH